MDAPYAGQALPAPEERHFSLHTFFFAVEKESMKGCLTRSGSPEHSYRLTHRKNDVSQTHHKKLSVEKESNKGGLASSWSSEHMHRLTERNKTCRRHITKKFLLKKKITKVA